MDKCQSFVQKFIATVGTNENLKGNVIKKQTKKKTLNLYCVPKTYTEWLSQSHHFDL